MGVCGVGKSTVGRALAQGLGLRFIEGDELHPPQNVHRMSAGIPLDDEARQDWLHAVGQALAGASTGAVASCSALKRSYRDVLRSHVPGLRFVHLHGASELLEQRLAARRGHYMPATLLQSQLDTLQWPQPDEAVLSLNVLATPEQLVQQAMAALDKTPLRAAPAAEKTPWLENTS